MREIRRPRAAGTTVARKNRHADLTRRRTPQRLVLKMPVLCSFATILFGSAVLFFPPFVSSLSNNNTATTTRLLIEDEEIIDQCVSDPTTQALLDEILRIDLEEEDAGTWFIPVDAQDKSNANNRQIPILGKERFEWFANVLPHQYDKDNEKNIHGLPPPLFSFLSWPWFQQFPFFNYRWDTSDWGYNKWNAFPQWVLPMTGKDPKTARSSDARNTLFAKNRKDRGPHNLLKQQYMVALTCDKLPLYESKLDKVLDEFYNDITIDGKPVMSSWYQRAFELYLDLHLHSDTDHPDYVLEYVQIFTQLMAPGNDDIVLQYKRDLLARGTCLQPSVQSYFDERKQYIVENDIQSTFVYWWDQAGIVEESVLFEAVHNILAWGQFLNILFLVIRARLQGYVAVENLLQDPAIKKIDFFTAQNDATTDNQRLDVAREAYRMLTPNQFWLSQAETIRAGYNDDKFISDDDWDRPFAIHFPLVIQAMNDDFDVLWMNSAVSKYDTSRYKNFQPNVCPFAKLIDSPNNFTVSEIDGETVVPSSHTEYFPVFESGQRPWLFGKVNGPKFCPFGLGYRRCPAEIFNLFILQKLLDKLGDLDFRLEGNNTDMFEDLQPGTDAFDEAIPMALARARDNIYVQQ